MDLSKVSRSRIKILNIYIDNLSLLEALELINSGIVFTPNIAHLMNCYRDKEYFALYQKADFALCDSFYVRLASFYLNSPIKERLAGSEFFIKYCCYHAINDEKKIFLLGGETQIIAEAAKLNINTICTKKIVVGTYSPQFGFENDSNELTKILDLINDSNANVLAVGLSSPKQETFIINYKHSLINIKTYFAIGATINFLGNYRKKSPLWLSEIGLEWFHRLLNDPVKIGLRVIKDLSFFYLLYKQKKNM